MAAPSDFPTAVDRRRVLVILHGAVTGGVILLPILSWLAPTEDAVFGWPIGVATMAVVLASSVAAARAVRRRVWAKPPSDDAEAADRFRMQLVIEIALFEAPAVTGFAMSFVSEPVVSVLGSLASLLLLLSIAPTSQRVATADRLLTMRGCLASVSTGLGVPPESSA